MFVAERFLSTIVQKYGEHLVSSDGGSWYPQACKFLKLVRHLHSSFEKSIIERAMQHIKDRTEGFDDYFPCKKKKCKLKHVKQWLNLFADYIIKKKYLNFTGPFYYISHVMYRSFESNFSLYIVKFKVIKYSYGYINRTTLHSKILFFHLPYPLYLD